MSEVTVKANQPVFGLPDGAVVTVERTERVDGAINAGILTVVGEATVEPLGEPVRDPDKLPEPSDDDATEPIADTDTLPDDAETPKKTPTARGKSRTT